MFSSTILGPQGAQGAQGTTPTSRYCKVQRSSSQSIPNNVSPYPSITVMMDAIQFNSGEFSISAGGILCPTTGVYHVTGYASWGPGACGPQLVITVGDIILQAEYFSGVTYGDNKMIAGVFYVTGGQVVKFGVRTTPGSTLLGGTLALFAV
jgi:hypothetical protein